jgi:hypothetical protein
LKIIAHICILLLSGTLCANTSISLSNHHKDELGEEHLREAIDHLASKKTKYKDERNYIEWIYYRIHRKYLKRYKQYSSMKETLLFGKYDCVTGTALYATIFQSLGFDIAIKESTYHIYLLVDTHDGRVLIESTDPINGVITDPEIMSSWLSGNISLNASSDGQQPFEPILNKDITMDMLVGLLHFNQSVRFFNEGMFTHAMGYIEAAIDHYPSDRMFQMAAIVAEGMRMSTTVDPIIIKVYCEKYLSEDTNVIANN